MMFLCIECGKNLDENRFYRKVKNRCKDCLNKKFKCELCEKTFNKIFSINMNIKIKLNFFSHDKLKFQART